MELHENDLDTIIYKSSTELPTYHFAHLVDDYLMHNTNIISTDKWVSCLHVHY